MSEELYYCEYCHRKVKRDDPTHNASLCADRLLIRWKLEELAKLEAEIDAREQEILDMLGNNKQNLTSQGQM